MMDRRTFLKGGGVVLVLAAGGGVWRAYDQGVFRTGEGPAYEPWRNWRHDRERGPLRLVRAAILAASPHNTQPWLFKITDSRIELFLDTGRNVGALDPYLREAHIGLGCALENLMLAAAAEGYAAAQAISAGTLAPIPADRKPRIVAGIDLSPAEREATDLYEAIPQRHTNRSLYDPKRPLPSDFVAALRGLASGEPDVKLFFFTEEMERSKIVSISSSANTEIYSDPDVARDAELWIRSRWSSVQRFRDGLTIDAFGLSPITTAAAKMMSEGMLRRVVAGEAKKGYSRLMSSAPLIGIIAVRDRYDGGQSLHAGRVWQRAHLLATTRDIAARPCNEAVEMIDHERALGREPKRMSLLAEIIGDAGWQPTFVFYMGYPTLQARASPRRNVRDVVL